jgi:hypothetical protein
MTVEAYLRSKVASYPWDTSTLEAACVSVLFARPNALTAISLEDNIEDIAKDDELTKSLKYAISTLYYTVSGVFSGGSKTEQQGDIKVSVSGFEVTQADREYYRSLADNLRDEIDCEEETDPNGDSGLFDATNLKKRWRR